MYHCFWRQDISYLCVVNTLPFVFSLLSDVVLKWCMAGKLRLKLLNMKMSISLENNCCKLKFSFMILHFCTTKCLGYLQIFLWIIDSNKQILCTTRQDSRDAECKVNLGWQESGLAYTEAISFLWKILFLLKGKQFVGKYRVCCGGF